MNIVIMGLPGAGKGTHAQRLEYELGMTHLSSGEILKQAIERETQLGMKARTYVEKGDLVPDEIVNHLMADKIKKERGEELLFDGFPRTFNQARELEQILDELGKKINLCLFLKVKEERLLVRISGRRICSKDGTVYHLEFNPPQKKGICDKCGAPLVQREDDKKEIVKKRISESKNRVMKIIEFYEQKEVLERLEGTDKTPDQVHNDVRSVVKKYLRKR